MNRLVEKMRARGMKDRETIRETIEVWHWFFEWMLDEIDDDDDERLDRFEEIIKRNWVK